MACLYQILKSCSANGLLILLSQVDFFPSWGWLTLLNQLLFLKHFIHLGSSCCPLNFFLFHEQI